MKYTKPQDALHMLDLVVEGGGVMSWVREVRLFLSTLPAEFEIVEPGNVQVRWPEGLTRRRLEIFAERGSVSERDGALKALAAIAPEEKKKIRMVAWKNDILGYSPVLKPVNWGPEQDGWRKVGECEVTE